MTFAGNWLQVHRSSVSINSLSAYLRSTCLVPFFHSPNVLVKYFTMFVTDFAEIFWEKIDVGLQKVDFRLILHPIALYKVNRSYTKS